MIGGRNMEKLLVRPIILALVVAGITHSGSVAASGIALFEQSGSSAGNAFAGGAAVADDASTIFFNPAGLTRLKGNQFAVAGHGIYVDANYTSESATTAGAPLTGGNGGNAGGWVFVPNIY